ncbi:hypothetical protein P3S68_016019 [Capsicum galapagoense]
MQQPEDLLRELGNPLVRHEGRRLNRAADILAKAGRKKEVHRYFEEWAVPPVFIRNAVIIDKRELPLLSSIMICMLV